MSRKQMIISVTGVFNLLAPPAEKLQADLLLQILYHDSGGSAAGGIPVIEKTLFGIPGK